MVGPGLSLRIQVQWHLYNAKATYQIKYNTTTILIKP